jgi:LacI family transcriptional regulator
VGYRKTLAEAGLDIAEDLVLAGDFDYRSGYEAARQLLSGPHPPTAIFACNDLMAIGAIRAATELDRPVPSRVSIVGFDDIRLASFANPPLTTIAQPKHELGVIAAGMLVKCIVQGKGRHQRRVLPTELIVRGSTAPPSK